MNGVCGELLLAGKKLASIISWTLNYTVEIIKLPPAEDDPEGWETAKAGDDRRWCGEIVVDANDAAALREAIRAGKVMTLEGVSDGGFDAKGDVVLGGKDNCQIFPFAGHGPLARA